MKTFLTVACLYLVFSLFPALRWPILSITSCSSHCLELTGTCLYPDPLCQYWLGFFWLLYSTILATSYGLQGSPVSTCISKNTFHYWLPVDHVEQWFPTWVFRNPCAACFGCISVPLYLIQIKGPPLQSSAAEQSVVWYNKETPKTCHRCTWLGIHIKTIHIQQEKDEDGHPGPALHAQSPCAYSPFKLQAGNGSLKDWHS